MRVLYKLRRQHPRESAPLLQSETQEADAGTILPLDILADIIGKYIPVEEILQRQYYSLSKRMRNKVLRCAVLHQELSQGTKSFLWLNLLCRTDKLFEKEARASQYEFFLNQTRTDEELAEIQRDVVRTMPSHSTFASTSICGEKNRDKLFDLLRAVSAAEPAVGYCQGMNFVAATLLLNLEMNQEKSFLVFLSLLRFFHFKNLYSPSVPLLPLRMFMFSRLVRQHVPQVWHHLNSKTFSVDIFANQWIMTLYSYYLDPEILGDKIWTLFFLLGWKFIFVLGLAVLSLLQQHIVAMDVEEISTFMASTKSLKNRDSAVHPFTVKEQVPMQLEIALKKFRVTNSDLDLLAQQFLTQKIITVVQDADLSPGSSRSHLHASNSDHSMEAVDSKQIGFRWLTTREGRKAFLRIDLSFLHTPNRPMESLETWKSPTNQSGIVDVPVHSLQQMTKAVDMVSVNFLKEINRLSGDLKEVEKTLNAENKQFNSFVANAKQTDETYLEILNRKQSTTSALQQAVLGGSGNVPELLKAVSDIEKEFDDRKELRNSLYAVISAQERKIASIVFQKSELIVKISNLANDLENTRHDVIYRSIQSAIESFSTNV